MRQECIFFGGEGTGWVGLWLSGRRSGKTKQGGGWPDEARGVRSPRDPKSTPQAVPYLSASSRKPLLALRDTTRKCPEYSTAFFSREASLAQEEDGKALAPALEGQRAGFPVLARPWGTCS